MFNAAPIIVDSTPSWLPSSLKERDKEISFSFRFSKPERKIYRKRKKIPPSGWVEKHRVITAGSLPGKWRNRVTPYLPGIMDASFFPTVQSIIICKAPQVGGSECVNNCIGYAVDRDPGPALYVYPDEQTAKENSRDRIQLMITSSPRLRSYLTGVHDDEATMRINLQHMPIYMAWARSAARLANKPIRFVVFDETDKYPDTANLREADPISLGEKRTIWFKYNRKIWKLSTPTIEKGPIWKAFTTEAQVIFDYWVCCPACGKLQLMEFETERKSFRWPEDEWDPEKIESQNLARYVCKHCDARWDDATRNAAVRWGKWFSRDGHLELFDYLNTHRPTKIAFHIPSWISPLITLSEVAAAFIRGQKDKNKLKDFCNNHKAEPWKDYTVERKEERILTLRDNRPRGMVPGGGVVSCLLAGVDTQDEGFYYRVRAFGWGMDLESWGIREGFIDSFNALAQVLWHERYADADGNDYYVHLAVQDAMGHRTSEVYDFVRMHPGLIIPSQGIDTRRMTQPLAWSNIEFYPGTKKPIPGGVKLLRVDVTYYKNQLAGKLEIAPEDPGAFHLHEETTEEYARQMCAEYIDPDKQIWVCPENRANHFWDCEVLCLAAADLLRVKFWKKEEYEKGIVSAPTVIKPKWMTR